LIFVAAQAGAAALEVSITTPDMPEPLVQRDQVRVLAQ
jgi:hypothetical protein